MEKEFNPYKSVTPVKDIAKLAAFAALAIGTGAVTMAPTLSAVGIAVFGFSMMQKRTNLRQRFEALKNRIMSIPGGDFFMQNMNDPMFRYTVLATLIDSEYTIHPGNGYAPAGMTSVCCRQIANANDRDSVNKLSIEGLSLLAAVLPALLTYRSETWVDTKNGHPVIISDIDIQFLPTDFVNAVKNRQSVASRLDPTYITNAYILCGMAHRLKSKSFVQGLVQSGLHYDPTPVFDERLEGGYVIQENDLPGEWVLKGNAGILTIAKNPDGRGYVAQVSTPVVQSCVTDKPSFKHGAVIDFPNADTLMNTWGTLLDGKVEQIDTMETHPGYSHTP